MLIGNKIIRVVDYGLYLMVESVDNIYQGYTDIAQSKLMAYNESWKKSSYDNCLNVEIVIACLMINPNIFLPVFIVVYDSSMA